MQQGKDDIHPEVTYIINGQRWDRTGTSIFYLLMTGKISQEDRKA